MHYIFSRSAFVAAFSILCLSSTPSIAYVADGHEYDLTCTDDGYQLTSKYPVSRTVGSGAGTRYITERETLYLGRSCDAYLKPYGYGSWCWANGGFVAEFDEERIGFPRQELWCEPERDFDLNCRC